MAFNANKSAYVHNRNTSFLLCDIFNFKYPFHMSARVPPGSKGIWEFKRLPVISIEDMACARYDWPASIGVLFTLKAISSLYNANCFKLFPVDCRQQRKSFYKLQHLWNINGWNVQQSKKLTPLHGPLTNVFSLTNVCSVIMLLGGSLKVHSEGRNPSRSQEKMHG